MALRVLLLAALSAQAASTSVEAPPTVAQHAVFEVALRVTQSC
jgi:hypothetical protein